MRKLYLRLLVFCGIIATAPLTSVAHGSAEEAMELTLSGGPAVINDTFATSMINVTGVRSDTDCAMRCFLRGCAVAKLNGRRDLCQLVVINNLTTPSASAGAGSKKQRLFGTDPGDAVWISADQQSSGAVQPTLFALAATTTGRIGAIQSVTVFRAGCYRIEASGARGGAMTSVGRTGGYGASMSGYFRLPAGAQLSVVVGQAGVQASPDAGAGGGGGSFIYRKPELLLAAGGGGGAAHLTDGFNGQAGPNGTGTMPCSCPTNYAGFGGVNGASGQINIAAASATYYIGGAGAGWLGMSSVVRRSTRDGESGGGEAQGWLGGLAGVNNAAAVGGFGGGGGGADSGGASGGGGGFSGGGAGVGYHHPGGGGGSYCGGVGCSGVTGSNTESDGGTALGAAVADWLCN